MRGVATDDPYRKDDPALARARGRRFGTTRYKAISLEFTRGDIDPVHGTRADVSLFREAYTTQLLYLRGRGESAELVLRPTAFTRGYIGRPGYVRIVVFPSFVKVSLDLDDAGRLRDYERKVCETGTVAERLYVPTCAWTVEQEVLRVLGKMGFVNVRTPAAPIRPREWYGPEAAPMACAVLRSLR